MNNFNEKLPINRDHWSNNRVHFFKYMSVQTAIIVLQNRTLRWSTPGTLNDPYDVQFSLNIDINENLLKRLISEKIWSLYSGNLPPDENMFLGKFLAYVGNLVPHLSKNEIEEKFSDVLDECYQRLSISLPKLNEDILALMQKSKILCLTEDPTIVPMWTHYADSNRGVVLRFRSISFLDSPFVMAKPVNYTDSTPTLIDEHQLSDLATGAKQMDPRINIEKLAFTKGSAWSYEKEWRIHSGNGRSSDAPFEDLNFHDLELDGIIFGLNMTDQNQSQIRDLAKAYSNINFFKVARSLGGFSHTILSLD